MIKCEFRKLTTEGVKQVTINGQSFLSIEPRVLTHLAEEVFRDAEYFLTEEHLEHWKRIVEDPEASDNDKLVCYNLIENAVISAEGKLPLCQDTGTATVFAWRGERVLTGGQDRELLDEGIVKCWQNNCLRNSQVAPLTMFEEVNTGNNMPSQIDIQFVPGDEYHFMFMAKGGGSANKTVLHQGNKALLNRDAFESFLRQKIGELGVAACPPYTIVVVVGGTSPEENLKTMKLASTGWYDALPNKGNKQGQAFRDKRSEDLVMRIAEETGWGAQFGGKHMALDARVIRLARHGGSCPVSVGVSCSAHRNVAAKITKDGVFIQKLETDPKRLLDACTIKASKGKKIDLNKPMPDILSQLSKHGAGSMVLLNGTLIVARDMAHAQIRQMVLDGQPLPAYFKDHPIYYAGPAKTPEGYAIGSFGPTTAQRMDGYMDFFMSRGASLVTLAKGNRAPEVANACKKYGGFYLGTVGGAAALIAKEYITKSEVLDFPEFGMEAVHRITVKDMPAFIIYDKAGKRLY